MRHLLPCLILVPVCAALPLCADSFSLSFAGSVCSSSANGSGSLVACANGSYVNQAYGDNSEVNLAYTDLITGNSLEWWGTGYNNLNQAVWGGTGDGAGQSWDEIVLSPTAGYRVTITGFDLGAYPSAQLSSTVQIVDINTSTVLLNYGQVSVGAGNVATHFTPNIGSTDVIAVEWKNTAYNVGLDNLAFSMTSASVPEPGSWLLMSTCLALAGLAALRLRG